jgi:hypothetical protein
VQEKKGDVILIFHNVFLSEDKGLSYTKMTNNKKESWEVVREFDKLLLSIDHVSGLMQSTQSTQSSNSRHSGQMGNCVAINPSSSHPSIHLPIHSSIQT